MQTIIETLNVDFGDNTLPILCNDSAGICTVGTDFIFDCLNPAGYSTGAVPSSGSAVGTLVNLARDVAPAITAAITGITRGAVTASAANSGSPPLFDGHGWAFNTSSQLPMKVHKAGLADTRVCEPTLEGFANYLEIVWLKQSSYTANASPWFHGQLGGANPTGGLIEAGGVTGCFEAEPGNSPVITGVSGVVQIALYWQFNVGAGTTSVTAFVNGVQFGNPVVGPAISTFVASNSNALCVIGGVSASGATAFSGDVYRVVREYTGISGVSAAAFVAADYAYAAGRFS